MSLLSKKQKKIHSGIRKKGYLGGFSIMAHLFHWCRSPPRGQSHSQLDRVWKGSHPSHLHLDLFLVLPHPQMHDIPIDTRGKKIRWRWFIRVYQSTQPLFMGRALYQLSYCGTLNVQNILIQLKKGISLINKKYFKKRVWNKAEKVCTPYLQTSKARSWSTSTCPVNTFHLTRQPGLTAPSQTRPSSQPHQQHPGNVSCCKMNQQTFAGTSPK